MTKKLTTLDKRMPAWDYQDLETRHCPICKSSGGTAKYQRPDQLIVNECTNCGTWYISPSPTEEALNKFYSKYSNEHQKNYDHFERSAVIERKKEKPLNNHLIQKILCHKDLKGKKCLELGFGNGQFLYLLKKLGALPSGVDLDPAAGSFAKKALGLTQVKRGTIFDLSPQEKFDVIIMNNFVEHVLNIRKVLERACGLLNKNGLIIITTPNGASAYSQESPVLFRVDFEHMQYFSPNTLNFIAKKMGLAIVHTECYGFPDLISINRSIKKQNNKEKLLKNIKSYLRALPGINLLLKIKACLLSGKQNNCPTNKKQIGNYTIFCILKKIS